MNKKDIIVIVVLLIILIGGVYLIFGFGQNQPKEPIQNPAGENSAPLETLNPGSQNQEQTQGQGQNTKPSSYNIKGMKVEIIKQGTGVEAKTGDMVTVNYTGTLTNGTKFDSSLNPGRTPFQFTLGQNMVIQGWELGVLGMKVGEKRKLTIPPELGYGPNAVGDLIPANATLLFDVELLKIN